MGKYRPAQIATALKNFLFGILDKEFLIFLFFLVISALFWLTTTLNETYEKELAVPLELTEVPRNVVITDSLPASVRFTVRDKGFFLMSYLYGDHIRPVKLSFQTYADKQNGTGQIAVSEVQRLFAQQLFGSTKITSVKADRLAFGFNYGQSRKVPVKLAGKVTPAKNFHLTRVEIQPEKVTVYAQKNLLDSIRWLTTVATNFQNFEDTLRSSVRLSAPKGVKVVPSAVQVTLYTDVLTEESVEVPVTTLNTPDDKILRTFPSRVKVLFTVGATQFRKVSADQFTVEADYNEVADHASEKCTLRLKEWPHQVKNARLESEQVDYLVEKK